MTTQDTARDEGIHCLACKERTESQGVERVTMKNGKPALKAVCGKCGRVKYRFLKAGT